MRHVKRPTYYQQKFWSVHMEILEKTFIFVTEIVLTLHKMFTYLSTVNAE